MKDEEGEENSLFRCPHCDFSAKHEISLRRHTSLIHEATESLLQGKNRIRKCKFCIYVAPNKHELTRHTRKHTGERPYPCDHPGCTFASKSPGDLKRHQKGVHLKLKPFACNLCDYKTTQKHHLERHMLTHRENTPDIKFKICGLCPYKTVFPENLRRHKITVHSNDRPFKCPHSNCDYAGKFEPALKGHLLSHLKDNSWKPLKCPWPDCTYRGKIPTHIRRHMTKHTNEKPYKCTLCPKAYTSHVTLVHHMSVHTKEIHYPCSLCDYGTRVPQFLKRHILSHHSKQRPFKCHIPPCCFSSNDQHRLNIHLSLKHGIRGPTYFDATNVNARKNRQTREKKNVEQKIPSKCLETAKVNTRKNRGARRKNNLDSEQQIDQKMSFNCRVPRCNIITSDGKSMASHLFIVHDLPRVVLYRLGLNV